MELGLLFVQAATWFFAAHLFLMRFLMHTQKASWLTHAASAAVFSFSYLPVAGGIFFLVFDTSGAHLSANKILVAIFPFAIITTYVLLGAGTLTYWYRMPFRNALRRSFHMMAVYIVISFVLWTAIGAFL